MNPLLYKAHPLLHLSVDILTNPGAHTPAEVFRLVFFYLAINVVWTLCLIWGTRKAAGHAPSYPWSYGLALVALVFYLPLVVTLLSDVLHHEFHFSDRFILVFCLFVATQMLGALYAVAIRNPRNGSAVGFGAGFAVSLLLWLASLPLGLVLLGLETIVKIP